MLLLGILECLSWEGPLKAISPAAETASTRTGCSETPSQSKGSLVLSFPLPLPKLEKTRKTHFSLACLRDIYLCFAFLDND